MISHGSTLTKPRTNLTGSEFVSFPTQCLSLGDNAKNEQTTWVESIRLRHLNMMGTVNYVNARPNKIS